MNGSLKKKNITLVIERSRAVTKDIYWENESAARILKFNFK